MKIKLPAGLVSLSGVSLLGIVACGKPGAIAFDIRVADGHGRARMRSD